MHDTQYSTVTSKPNYKTIFCHKDFVNIRGGSRTAATFKMERFTKRSMLDVAAVLDPPLNISYNIKRLDLKYLSAKEKRSENSCQDMYFLTKLLVIDLQVYFKIGSLCFFSPQKCSPLSIRGLYIASYFAWYFQLFSQSLIPFKLKLWHPLLEYGNITMDRSIL